MGTNLRVDVDGAVARVTLDRPRVLNALSVDLLDELIDACSWLHRQDDVRVVVLAGEGHSFSAGADLATAALLEEDGPSARVAAGAGDRAASAIEGLPQITVAALQGRCVGGGLVLAVSCDLRIAADDTVFSVPEIDLGIPLAWGGIPRLLRELSPGVVRDLVLTCREVGATEAHTYGLVSRVVPRTELDAEVQALSASLGAKARLPVRATLDAVAAVTGMGAPRGWSDADTLLTAFRDPEARAAGAATIARVTGQDGTGGRS